MIVSAGEVNDSDVVALAVKMQLDVGPPPFRRVRKAPVRQAQWLRHRKQAQCPESLDFARSAGQQNELFERASRLLR